MLACEICSRTSDRDREIENLREDREAILTTDARESKEECCDALEVLARHHDDCEGSLRSMGVHHVRTRRRLSGVLNGYYRSYAQLLVDAPTASIATMLQKTCF